LLSNIIRNVPLLPLFRQSREGKAYVPKIITKEGNVITKLEQQKQIAKDLKTEMAMRRGEIPVTVPKQVTKAYYEKETPAPTELREFKGEDIFKESDAYKQMYENKPPAEEPYTQQELSTSMTVRPPDYKVTWLGEHVYKPAEETEKPVLSKKSLGLIKLSKDIAEKTEEYAGKTEQFLSPHAVYDQQTWEQQQVAKLAGGFVKSGGGLASMGISAPAGAEIAVKRPEYIFPGALLTAYQLTVGAAVGAVKHPHETAAMLALTGGITKFGGRGLSKAAVLDIKKVSVVERGGVTNIKGLYVDAFGKSKILGGVKEGKPFIGSPELTLKPSWRPTTPHEAAAVKQSFKSMLTEPEAAKFESILEISHLIGKERPIHVEPIKLGEQTHVPSKAAAVESIIKSDPGHVFYGSAAQRAQSIIKSERLPADIDLQASNPIKMGQSILKELKARDPYGAYKASHGGRLIETAAGEHMFDIHNIHPPGSYYAQKWGLRVQKPVVFEGQRLEPIGAQVAKKGLATTERIVEGKLEPPSHRRLKDIRGFEEGLSEIITIKKSAVESSYFGFGEYAKLKKLKSLTGKAGLKTTVGEVPLPKVLRLFESTKRRAFVKSETAQAQIPKIKFTRRYPEYKQYPAPKDVVAKRYGYTLPLSAVKPSDYVAPIPQKPYDQKLPVVPKSEYYIPPIKPSGGYHPYPVVPTTKGDEYYPPVPPAPKGNEYYLPVPPISSTNNRSNNRPIPLIKGYTGKKDKKHYAPKHPKRGYKQSEFEHLIGGWRQFVEPIKTAKERKSELPSILKLEL
jgi:hypothetical protein